jgi:type I restriction enzyme S subunit
MDWLGEIPTHWGTKRLKFAISFLGGGTPTKENREYWEGDIPWVSPKDMKAEQIYDTEDHITPAGVLKSSTHLVQPGSVLIVVRSGILRHTIPVAINMREVELNQDMKALTPKTGLEAAFLKYVILGGNGVLLCIWRKQGATVESIEHELLANTPVPVPPKVEQERIIEFLDRETAKIDALVTRKQSLIDLLQEKRTALIIRAVTKGLNPSVPMKDSGVEWLGAIPTHWKVLALSRLTLSRCDGPFGSGLKSEHYSMDGVRVIRLQNIGWTEFLDNDRAYINGEYARSLGNHSVTPGDVLIAGLGDEQHPVGRSCVAPYGIEPAIVKADCFRFRLDRRRIISDFAAYQLSAGALAAAGSLSTGATRSRMNLTVNSNRLIALPPKEEQQVIVDVLHRASDRHFATIAKLLEAINRLKEYRTALISAAVTGKIDVRKESA